MTGHELVHSGEMTESNRTAPYTCRTFEILWALMLKKCPSAYADHLYNLLKDFKNP